ncbi:hypothetical protein NEUTE2DRAFT_163628 [Neurospora tetrasperma FGSC 2509]|nr:hypothetical protein NEUTE2DRAFT_163628 [Neurospora tetrasperma FGSC 2509]
MLKNIAFSTDHGISSSITWSRETACLQHRPHSIFTPGRGCLRDHIIGPNCGLDAGDLWKARTTDMPSTQPTFVRPTLRTLGKTERDSVTGARET